MTPRWMVALSLDKVQKWANEFTLLKLNKFLFNSLKNNIENNSIIVSQKSRNLLKLFSSFKS